MKTKERKSILKFFLVIGLFLSMSHMLHGANAPVVTIGSVCNAVPGEQIVVPIKVANFNNIAAFTLTMDYEYGKLQFISGTYSPLLGGVCNIGEIVMPSGIRRVTISWFKSGNTGINLVDGAALANYTFKYISGPVDLKWFEMGPSCEFTDPSVNILNDSPTSSYYINGLVSETCSTKPTITANGATKFCEGGSVELTASAGSAWKWLPGGATTKSITVDTSGSYTVEVTDASGEKSTSDPIVVTVTLNVTPGVTIQASANPTCYGEKVTFTATAVNEGENPSYQWKKGDNNVGIDSPIYTDDALVSGSISVVLTSSLSCVTSTKANSNVIDFRVNESGQWLGITSSDWNTASNWCGGVPTSSTNVFIPSGVTQPVIGVSVTASCNNISIAEGATLTLKSDASGTGSLIVSGSAFGAGNVFTERYMTTDTWHLVSSPLSGQSISAFLNSNPNVAEAAENANIRGMMDYNPVANQWNDYFTNSTTGNLGGGKGFCLRTDANTAVVFSGSIQSGNQTASGLVSDKFNCIGNPYTSAIQINGSTASFLTANIGQLDPSFGAVYVWDQPNDDNNGQYGQYSVYSNASPAFEVQQGQAFLVHMNAEASQIGFNPAMQLHNAGLELKSNCGKWPTIKLHAKMGSQGSSTVLTFGDSMTRGLDPGFDAGLLRGGSDLYIYSKLINDNGVPFAIQALPAGNFNSLIIPIGLENKSAGELNFSSELINLSSDWKVILEDKLSKTFTDLSLNDYRIAVSATTVFSDRFNLHVSNLKTGIKPSGISNSISACANRNEMRIVGVVGDHAVASIYDLTGRLILIENLKAGSHNIIRLPLMKTGIYMLLVKDDANVQGFKVPIQD